MYRPRIIPVILVDSSGGAVKTIRFGRSIYIGDPVNAVSLFNAFQVDELVLLDIAATRERRLLPAQLMADIASEAKMPFAVGGGITSVDDVHKILSAGAEKVVISTSALENPALVRAASNRFGSSSIVVCIDVGKNFLGRRVVRSRGGTRPLPLSPLDAARMMEHMGAGELIIQSIDRDGTMAGYDLELLDKVAEAVGVPVIALGGAGSMEHMREAYAATQASAFASGSLFCFQDTRRGVLIRYPGPTELDSFRNIRPADQA